jgi:glycosyltransferase involved in cell wall biosynthesis
MRDLALEFSRQGHEPVVITPSAELLGLWESESAEGVQVLHLAAATTKDISYLRRTLAELMLPYAMIRALRRSPYRETRWDLVVWYSPTIFFGPLICYLKWRSRCPAYLILRDIFPEWAYDLGLVKKGPIYAFLKMMANFQYAIADIIGVQTDSNLIYLNRWSTAARRLEVLHNWQTPLSDSGSTILVSRTVLAGRKIFIYVGNMGVAQGMDIFLDLAERLKCRLDLGFMFVGRGSEVQRLRGEAKDRALENTLFFNEIDPREISGLLAQCRVGLLALDIRHKTHNIPGKFLTYLNAGIPVLARVNPGTDLAHLIDCEDVGRVYVGDELGELTRMAEELIDDEAVWERSSANCRALGRRLFSPDSAVQKIIASVR